MLGLLHSVVLHYRGMFPFGNQCGPVHLGETRVYCCFAVMCQVSADDGDGEQEVMSVRHACERVAHVERSPSHRLPLCRDRLCQSLLV